MLETKKQIDLAIDLLLGSNVSPRKRKIATSNKWYNKGEIDIIRITKYLYINNIRLDYDFKFNDVIVNTMDRIEREFGSEFEYKEFRNIIVDAINRYIGCEDPSKWYLENVLYPMVVYNKIDQGKSMVTIIKSIVD